jgi:uncharacterized protein involved in response to NO
MPIPRLRDYDGPAILSYGFRPFFLLGSIYAGLAVLVWLPLFYGEIGLPTLFAPRDWHVHEMLYGFLPAVITGFLLTAIPNWTGRLPIQGRPLLVLVLAWLAGRLAVTGSGAIGWLAAAVIDASFLVLVAAAAAREIFVGRNWRNLKIVLVLCVLLAGNLTFHVEAQVGGVAEYGARLGIAATILLIMLIGGRIIPSFTRNWLVRENPGRLPASFGSYDKISLIGAGAALLAWLVAPDFAGAGVLLVAAGVLQAARLVRWAGDRTARDPLVVILHVAYAFVPLGFLLVGASSFGIVPPSAGLHGWMGGAAGTMTLAVMSRASLGHTGRPLEASRALQAVYALVVGGALARVGAALQPSLSFMLLHVAAFAWAGAFLGFAVSYWPILARPRLSG